MSNDVLLGLAGAIISAAFSIILYFLKEKDRLQQRQITLLFEKHDADAKLLDALKLEIAHDYHDKRDIEKIMTANKTYLDEKFGSLERLIEQVAKK